jgi:hypothetical protein
MNPNLVQRTLTLIHGVEQQVSTPEQHDALASSKLILHFIQERNEASEFEAYLQSFNTGPQRPLFSFATKEEAESWLRAHPAPPHGAFVGVGDALFHVAYLRELEHRKLLPLPSQEEWARMEAEEEAEEELATHSPSPGRAFNVFDLLNKTSYHLHELEARLSSPEEHEALRIARIAFHFVMRMGEDHGFEEYLEALNAARRSRPSQSFAIPEEAESWLATQPEPPPPSVVAIGSELYAVGYHRGRGLRVLLRLPTPLELNPAPGGT